MGVRRKNGNMGGSVGVWTAMPRSSDWVAALSNQLPFRNYAGNKAPDEVRVPPPRLPPQSPNGILTKPPSLPDRPYRCCSGLIPKGEEFRDRPWLSNVPEAHQGIVPMCAPPLFDTLPPPFFRAELQPGISEDHGRKAEAPQIHSGNQRFPSDGTLAAPHLYPGSL